MPSVFHRWIITLLIPCLLADAAHSPAFAHILRACPKAPAGGLIAVQALAIRAVPFTRPALRQNLLSRWTEGLPEIAIPFASASNFLRQHLNLTHFLGQMDREDQILLNLMTPFILVVGLIIGAVYASQRDKRRREKERRDTNVRRRNLQKQWSRRADALRLGQSVTTLASYSTYDYEQGLDETWRKAVRARTFTLAPHVFLKRLFNDRDEEVPLGGYGFVADLPRKVQKRLDDRARFLKNLIDGSAVLSLKSKVLFLPKARRHLTVAGLGISPELSQGPSAQNVGQAQARAREIILSQKEIQARMGETTTFHDYGAVAAQLHFGGGDLRRMDQMQIALGASALRSEENNPVITQYHVTYAWVKDLNEEESAEWKRILLRARQESEKESSSEGWLYFSIQELHLRSFAGFFKTTHDFGTFRLLSPKAFDRWRKKGRREITRALQGAGHQAYDDPRMRNRLQAWLGLFPSVYLSNIAAFEVAVGKEKIKYENLEELAAHQETLAVTSEDSPEGLKITLTGQHRRSGLIRSIIGVMPAFSRLSELMEPPPDERSSDVELHLTVQNLADRERTQLLKALAAIPDIALAGQAAEPHVKHARGRILIPPDPERLRLFLFGITDFGDNRIRITSMRARRTETDSMEVTLELEMPETVNLPSMASHLEVSSRGRFLLPLEEFETPADRVAKTQVLVRAVLDAQEKLLKRFHPVADAPAHTLPLAALHEAKSLWHKKDVDALAEFGVPFWRRQKFVGIYLDPLIPKDWDRLIPQVAQPLAAEILKTGDRQIEEINVGDYDLKGIVWSEAGETYFTPFTQKDYSNNAVLHDMARSRPESGLSPHPFQIKQLLAEA